MGNSQSRCCLGCCDTDKGYERIAGNDTRRSNKNTSEDVLTEQETTRMKFELPKSLSSTLERAREGPCSSSRESFTRRAASGDHTEPKVPDTSNTASAEDTGPSVKEATYKIRNCGTVNIQCTNVTKAYEATQDGIIPVIAKLIWDLDKEKRKAKKLEKERQDLQQKMKKERRSAKERCSRLEQQVSKEKSRADGASNRGRRALERVVRLQSQLEGERQRSEERLAAMEQQLQQQRDRGREQVVTFVLASQSDRDDTLLPLEASELARVAASLYEEFSVQLLGVRTGPGFIMAVPASQRTRVRERQAEIQRAVRPLLLASSRGEAVQWSFTPHEGDVDLRLARSLRTPLVEERNTGADQIRSSIAASYCDQHQLHNELRIVLVGRRGAGISSTGNTILSKNPKTGGFIEGFGFQQTTSVCQQKSVYIRERTVKVIDTPGMPAPTFHSDNTFNEIKKGFLLSKPGPHAIVYVLDPVHSRDDDFQLYYRLAQYYGDSIKQYIILLFTHGDHLQGKGDILKRRRRELASRGETVLRNILDEVSQKLTIFHNHVDATTKSVQVHELLLMIDQMIRNNGEKPFFQIKAPNEGSEIEMQRFGRHTD